NQTGTQPDVRTPDLTLTLSQFGIQKSHVYVAFLLSVKHCWVSWGCKKPFLRRRTRNNWSELNAS
ncbi:MAG: hypothetical protein ACPF9K_03590, partial [Neptuniibacter sp.]